ncbi:hypothetical protein LTR36_009307 [Oleoguttula mirabilis]|uniref:Uncharacterized protein n=1 Tax=Oleoguttula mirabilis TaxID=1507867 RepID=A0AAV9J6L6_9PEZI|nr:hypothetical protein LTR36_009307 [Oleoguttula mirabilis]
MDPANLILPTLSPTLTAKTLPTPVSSQFKNGGKMPVQRVDLEPIYTQLKAALGEGWTEYKAAVNAFVLGNLNQAELSWVLQPLLSAAPSAITSADLSRSPPFTLHLHNTLIAVLCANLYRDPPPTDVAPWVVATDKPSTTTKNAGASGANDKAEERLKREIMSLHARDRRRIKTLKAEGATTAHDGLKDMQTYHHALAVKPPATDTSPQSAGGMGKPNWDLEIRRRYAQPLASETLEFPTLSEILSRVEPIAAEEGLAGSTQSTVQACAELVEQATEVYLKELLGNLRGHSRSNGEGCVQTASFRRQLHREEADAERGIVQRNAAGMLPVEVDVQAKSRALDMDDLRLGVLQNDVYLRRDLFLEESVWLNRYPEELGPERPRVNGTYHLPMLNGGASSKTAARAGADDAMVVDEQDYWQGGTATSRSELMSVLDDCLAVG